MLGFDFYKMVTAVVSKEQIRHPLETGMGCGDLILPINPATRSLLKQYEYPDDVIIDKEAKTYTFPWAYDKRYDTWIKLGYQSYEELPGKFKERPSFTIKEEYEYE